MAVTFEARIIGEHEPRPGGVQLSMQLDIPAQPGYAPMIDARDLPEAFAAEIGRRGDRVRITIERIA